MRVNVSKQSSPTKHKTKTPHGSGATDQSVTTITTDEETELETEVDTNTDNETVYAHKYRMLPTATIGRVTYRINKRALEAIWRALMDRGANGGIAGSDMRVLIPTGRYIDLSGIDDHTVGNLELVTATAVMRSQRGEFIGIFHWYARMPEQKSIHSCGQLEHHGIKVFDKLPAITKKQPCIQTPEGHIVPMQIRDGLV